MFIVDFMRALICILQIFLLTVATPVSMYAADAQLSYTDFMKLGQLEQLWFGSPHKSLPARERIDALELAVFGQHHHGTDSSRIAAISAVLNSGKDSFLMPPQPPRLDNAQSNHADLAGAATELPPAAPKTLTQSKSDYSPDPDKDKDQTKSMLHEALKLYSQGDVQSARAAFARVLAVDPKNADAYFNLGAIAESQGDFRAALNYYQKASESNPDDPDIVSAISSMQGKLANSMAKNTGTDQSASDDEHWQALKAKVDKAAAAYKAGEYDQAIEILQNVEKQAPERADVHYALSQAYKAKGRYEEAKAALNQSMAMDPNNQTYKEAAANLTRQINNGQSTKPFAENGYDTIASDDKSGIESNQVPGQITPFSSAGTPVGWQSDGGYAGSGTTAYYPAYAYRAHSSAANRIQRVAIGTMAGATFGAMLGGGYRGGRMQGALVGGLAGGLFGLLSGH